MFGYVVFNAETLPKERQARFRAFYCGLCRMLRRSYGLPGSVVLSYDMTFMALLLNALYEPGEIQGRERCIPHPVKDHDYIEAASLEYAAAMNIALAYHKCMDNWLDDRNPIALSEAGILKRAYGRVSARYPAKCAAIESWLDSVHEIEKAGILQVDPPMNATGKMLGELFAMDPGDVWAEQLGQIGDGLGRFIYFMDAYEDLPQDLRRKRYNPLKCLSEQADYEDTCRTALMMMAADATDAFEMLPIVQDADIIRNVLYSGIWTKYMMIRKKRHLSEKEQDNAGSL